MRPTSNDTRIGSVRELSVAPRRKWEELRARASTGLSTRLQLEQMLGSSGSSTNVTSPALSVAGRNTNGQWYTSDAWLSETVNAIKAYRGASDGWDGDGSAKPNDKALDAAEMLAAFFRDFPESHRPVLSVNADGIPAFARHLRDFYLHLVVEPVEQGSNHMANLSWYAIKDGEKIFFDAIPFDGTALPEELSIFAEA